MRTDTDRSNRVLHRSLRVVVSLPVYTAIITTLTFLVVVLGVPLLVR